MTEIYLHFLFAHYGLYGNAPVVVAAAEDAVGAAQDDGIQASNKMGGMIRSIW